jgi:hypothetical protein
VLERSIEAPSLAAALSSTVDPIVGRVDAAVSHPILRPKPDAHRMYAQDQVVIHMARM